MKRETEFWQRLKPRWPDFIERLEARGKLGVPDTHFLVRGLAGWAELKAPTDPDAVNPGLTGPQAVWLHTYAQAGGAAYVIAAVHDDLTRARVYHGETALDLYRGLIPATSEPVTLEVLYETISEDAHLRHARVEEAAKASPP